MNNTLIRAIRGPILLMTLGALFAFDNFVGYSFSATWPVLIIVFGALKLLEHLVGDAEPAAPPHAGGY